MILSRMYTFLNSNGKIYDRIWKGGSREFGTSSSGVGVRTCTILGGWWQWHVRIGHEMGGSAEGIIIVISGETNTIGWRGIIGGGVGMTVGSGSGDTWVDSKCGTVSKNVTSTEVRYHWRVGE